MIDSFTVLTVYTTIPDLNDAFGYTLRSAIDTAVPALRSLPRSIYLICSSRSLRSRYRFTVPGCVAMLFTIVCDRSRLRLVLPEPRYIIRPSPALLRTRFYTFLHFAALLPVRWWCVGRCRFPADFRYTFDFTFATFYDICCLLPFSGDLPLLPHYPALFTGTCYYSILAAHLRSYPATAVRFYLLPRTTFVYLFVFDFLTTLVCCYNLHSFAVCYYGSCSPRHTVFVSFSSVCSTRCHLPVTHRRHRRYHLPHISPGCSYVCVPVHTFG